MTEIDIRRYAAVGVEQEIARLNDVLASLRAESPSQPMPARANGHTRKRHTLTPAQRLAVSKRMRAYWAAKRKGAKG